MTDWKTVERSLAATLAGRRADTDIERTHRAVIARDPVDTVACALGDASCASAHAGIVHRAWQTSQHCTHHSILKLQRCYGNQYVGRVLRQVSGGAHAVEPASANPMDAIERSIDGARGDGQAMDYRTRTQMESAFSADFSAVRIHADDRADGLSQQLSARAFATGHDIYFRHGEYSPGTSSGRELLAHELTHVVQQTGDGIHRKMTVSQPNDAHEVEADNMARAVMQLEHRPAAACGHEAVQRSEEEKQNDQLAAAPDSHTVSRQPEAPREDEEKKRA